MLERPVIELQEVRGRIEGDSVVLDVAVFNPEDRTLYAYATPRRILYDQATHALTIALHDQHVDPDDPIAPHLPQPRIEPLEGQAVTHVEFAIPRIVRRIRPAAERGGGPMTEELPAFAATQVTIEMAHQDVPYYHNPRLEKLDQLKEWGDQIATTTTQLNLQGGARADRSDESGGQGNNEQGRDE